MVNTVTITVTPDTGTYTPVPAMIHTPLIPTDTLMPTEAISTCPDISVSWKATPSAEWSPDITATMPIEAGKTLSPEEIAIALFCQYLEKYKSPQADISQRLNDYHVYNAPLSEWLQHLREEKHVDFVATVFYSVLPTRLSYSSWGAGSGEISNDGWTECVNDLRHEI